MVQCTHCGVVFNQNVWDYCPECDTPPIFISNGTVTTKRPKMRYGDKGYYD